MADDLLIHLAEVTKTYAADLPILDRVNLRAHAGETLAIVGPSGSGKSTLLNLIGGLDQPASGRVIVAGYELTSLPEPELARFRNREVGFVFQDHHLLPPCTVLENVLVPTLVLAGTGSGEPPVDRARRLLSLMGLDHRLDHFPAQLSGGEKQRVAVVRALINQPRLLLADEPTGSLDHASADRLACLLGELNQSEGVTIVMVTHARDIAGRMARILALRDGRLTETDQPAA